MTGQPSPEQLSLDRPINTAGQLLVEGRVPEMFFREMIAAMNLRAAIDVRTFGDISKDNLQTYIELLSQKPAFKEKAQRLGIVRDAEAAPASSALQSVQAALRAAGRHAPAAMNVLEGHPLASGVFILPNCHNPGALEDLCLTAIEETEQGSSGALLPCTADFFTCIEKRGRKPANISKARFACYALARDVIDPQLGRAAQKAMIPWNAKAFDLLKGFLRRIGGGS